MRGLPIAGGLVVYAIFAVSGGSALIYQILWSRWLSLSFGSTTTSVSIVLACFMAGLALGSAGAGRLMRRIRNPLRVYASMELGIAFYAVAFPWLFDVVDRILPLLTSAGSSPVQGLAVRVLFAVLLLLAPTTMMGATLPLLAEFFRRNPERTRSFKIGVLYAANTFGAALGILASSFALIELVGVFATTILAAALNLAAAAAGYHFSRSAASPAPERAAASGRPAASFPARLAVAVLTAGGAAAMASEVLWSRALDSIIGNSTYAFATIVFLYLVGIALGSWLMALAVPRLRRRSYWLALLQLTMGAWLLAAILIIGAHTEGLLQFNGKSAPMSTHLLIYLKVTAVLLPLSLASGACFPLAARMIDPESEDPDGESVGRAYGWNTLGGVAGSLLAGFLIAPRTDIFEALYWLALAYGAIALAALAAILRRERDARREPALWIPLAALGLLVVAAAAYGLTADNYFLRHFTRRPENHASKYVVLFHQPGMQGVVTAGRMTPMSGAALRGRPEFLLVNGGGMTVKVTETKLMAHLPLLLHPDPKDSLVICFGMGTTYRSALSHGGNVTVVELAREVTSAFPIFHADAARVLADPKGRIVINDGRNFLKLTRETFDVITVDPPPPIDAAGVVNLYTRDFLQLAKSRLNKGGVVAHWYPFQGTGSGVDDEASFYGLVATFAQTFPYVYGVLSYHKMGLHLIGSLEPLREPWGAIKTRLRKPEIARDLREWDPVPESYFAGVRPLPQVPRRMPILTDDNPWLEFYLLRTLRTGGKKMYPYRWW